MEEKITGNDKPKVEKLEIRRGNVAIGSTQKSPIVYTATEQVVWGSGQAQSGQAQINGLGKDRHAALDALEDSYNKLKEVLAVAE